MSQLTTAAADKGLAVARACWSRAVQSVGGTQQLRIIVLLASVLGLDMADKGTVSATADELERAFRIGQTDIGLLLAVASFVGGIATLPFGALADRLPRRTILTVTVIAWAAAMIVSGTASSFTYLIVTRTILGIATAAAWPCVASLTGDYFPAGERAWIYGLINAGELVGLGVGFFISGTVSSIAGWRWSFFVMAAPAIVLPWLLWRYLPEPQRGAQGALSLGEGSKGSSSAKKIVREARIEPRHELVLRENPAKWSLWRVLKYLLAIPTYSLLIAASALVYYFLAGARSFAMIYMAPHYHLSRGAVSALVFVLGIGALVGVSGGGRLAEHLLRRGYLKVRIVLPAAALLAAVPALGVGVFVRSPWVGVPFLTVAATLLAAAIPPIDAARLDIVPAPLWGRGEAGRMALRSMLEGGAPLLFAAMSGWLGGGENGLQWTFLIMLTPMLAASGLGWWARGNYPRDVATAAASAKAQRR